jgi:hypothetical protein
MKVLVTIKKEIEITKKDIEEAVVYCQGRARVIFMLDVLFRYLFNGEKLKDIAKKEGISTHSASKAKERAIEYVYNTVISKK